MAFARSLLGVSLAGQKKYAEAEPLLREGYEHLKPHQASLSADARAYLPKIIEKLVELCEATDRPADADQWKQELATFKRAKKGS